MTRRVEPVEENLLPVDLAFLRRLAFGRGRFGEIRRSGRPIFFAFLVRFLLVVLGLHEFEERVDEELLLEVLLQVQQRHVEQIHRLVQAWIDLELLPERGALAEPCLHRPFPSAANRARRRAVSVGPR